MKYVWEDLPKQLNCFTVKNTAMVNLNTGKAVRQYCTNTKIVVVQKCVTPDKTYYRTQEAEHHFLNYAFEAEAFGLPNEKAPSAHSKSTILDNSPGKSNVSANHAQKPIKKTNINETTVCPKDGEGRRHRLNWLSKIFRRSDGTTKNS